MNFSQKQIVMIVGGAILVLAIVALVFFNLQPSKTAPIQLTVWGLEKSDVFAGIISIYSQLHPNVGISYRQVGKDNYENVLLGALASGQGPDIFPVHNRGLAKNLAVLSPATASQFSQNQIDSLFPTEVGQDF